MVALASPALAGGGNDQGGNNNNQGGGHAAPASEIGASAIGMALAVGFAAYARRRRKR
jgi:LPXTG-motif cell wall-anchored protein